MKGKSSEKFNILAIDCCEHIISAIKKISGTRVTPITSRHGVNGSLKNHNAQLIVVGVARFPVRRLFLNRLRLSFPYVPILFLFREKGDVLNEEWLHGEFLITDRPSGGDLEMIGKLRKIFPLKSCEHISRGETHRLIRDTLQIITENYSDPHLSLSMVAKNLPTSPSKLSRILNQEVGISFRQMLRQIRIEEAKSMLASHKYNVKEVAARTGFSDSHYFSRSFKEVTGLTATEYEDSTETMAGKQ